MADWRQIQARIRRAKNSPEALAKLSELYQRTRDAMVAWELGVVEEKSIAPLPVGLCRTPRPYAYRIQRFALAFPVQW
jgi:hypothetical protein